MTRVSISFVLVGVVLVLGASVGCVSASRHRLPLVVPPPHDLSTADQLVRQGCYACLTEAARLYAAAADSASDPHDVDVRRRLTETLYLMAVRERELGIGSGTALDRARAEAARLPPPWDYTTYDGIVNLTAWHPGGVSPERRDELFDTMLRIRPQLASWHGQLVPPRPDIDPAGAYFLATLDCEASAWLRSTEAKPWTDYGEPPLLLQYRLARCGRADRSVFERIVAAEPRFSEVHLTLGELALAAGTLRTAERHLTAALDALPALTAAQLVLGHVYLAMDETELAREAYDAVVLAVPGQRDAMLGLAKTLTTLGRYDAAITVTDQMIALGTWHMGEAYYWRGVNHYARQHVDMAEADAMSARARLPMDPQVDKLAGLIALGRQDVPRAEREFRLAVEHTAGRGRRDCDAQYYLASTLIMQKNWAAAAPAFEAVPPCAALDIDDAKARLAEIAASDLSETRKARLTAGRQRTISTAEAQQARASYNAAVAHVNLGNLAAAVPLIENARGLPELTAGLAVLEERVKAVARK